MNTFTEAWARMVARGYQYSDANVEKVRMGWDMAMAAVLEAIDNIEEPAWYGYENPNTFDDGKRAAKAVVGAAIAAGVRP